MTIKSIGSFHPVDDDGYIGNPSIYPVKQQDYAEVVEYVAARVRELLTDNLHGIYLRGSVAKGEAIPFISDIDMLIITHQPLTDSDKEKLEQLQSSIKLLHPFVTKLELLTEHLPETEKKWLRFLLKTSCVCMWGTDLIPGMEPFKVSDHGKGQLLVIVKQIKGFEEELKTVDANDAKIIKEGCIWISKAILRAGFELVMERDNSYTRDLYPCYICFSKYYPGVEPMMRRVLEMAISPVADKHRLLQTINKMKHFFTAELQQRK